MDTLVKEKIPVIKTQEFTLYFEEVNSNIFLHCDVNVKWSKEVKTKLIDGLNILKDKFNMFVCLDLENKKLGKFIDLLGFEYLKSIIGNDNKDYDIYVWR